MAGSPDTGRPRCVQVDGDETRWKEVDWFAEEEVGGGGEGGRGGVGVT